MVEKQKKKAPLSPLAAGILLAAGIAMLILYRILPEHEYDGTLSVHPECLVFEDISADRTLAAVNDNYNFVYVIDYDSHAIRYIIESGDISEETDIYDVLFNDNNELFMHTVTYDPDTGVVTGESVVCYDADGNMRSRIALPQPDEEIYENGSNAFHFENGLLYCVSVYSERYNVLEIDTNSGEVSIVAEYENEEERNNKWISPLANGAYAVTWDTGEFGVLYPDGHYETTDAFDFRLREERSNDNILIDMATGCGDKLLILDGGFWDTVYTYEDGALVPFIDLKTVYGLDEDIPWEEYRPFIFENMFFPIHDDEGEIGITSSSNLILTDGQKTNVIFGEEGYALPLGTVMVNIIRLAALVVGGLLVLLGAIGIIGGLMKWHFSVLSKMLFIIVPIVVLLLVMITKTVLKHTEESYYENVNEEYAAINEFIKSSLDIELLEEIDTLEDKENGNVELLAGQLDEILSADSIGWSDNFDVTLYSYDPSGFNRSLVSSTGIYNFLDYNLIQTQQTLEPNRVGNSDLYEIRTSVYSSYYVDAISMIRNEDDAVIALMDVNGQLTKLEKNLADIRKNIIVQSIGLTLVLVALLILLSYYININLHRTSAAIKEIGEGHYENRIRKITKDELGDIALSVNQMASQIQRIQQSIITGISTMVESRDNSTGGHISRTSLVVSEFAETLLEHKDEFGFDEKFIFDLAKAAPMHDLGKIAVDDAVLRKPGRFTPEEYEKMKEHAPKGAVIVGKVLEDIDDREFVNTAVNVAHYHHEKWNGTGYPNGLKGEEIPIEARIMALADVLDALVSKRCYKEAYNYDRAFSIIENDCGSHFDPKLGKLFLSCRAKFEALYNRLDEPETPEPISEGTVETTKNIAGSL